MKLRPPNFEGLPALFRREVRIKPRELVTACIHLVEAYRAPSLPRDRLPGHLPGQCVLRSGDRGHPGLRQRQRRRRRQAGRNRRHHGLHGSRAGPGDPGASPGTQTDLHSLAVLLFMMLMNHHPLLGAREYRSACSTRTRRPCFTAGNQYSCSTRLMTATARSPDTRHGPGHLGRRPRLLARAFHQGVHRRLAQARPADP